MYILLEGDAYATRGMSPTKGVITALNFDNVRVRCGHKSLYDK
jgi:hypothetical protein